MQRLLFASTIAASALLGSFASADERVIYGEDDRLDVHDANVDPRMRELSRSTALLTRRAELTLNADRYRLDTTTFNDAYGLCESEPFRMQPTVGFCSGFLVGPDIMVTAGHCIRNQASCNDTSFVFGYSYDTPDKDLSSVPAADVYNCTQVIAQAMVGTGTDYAVVKLDRPVMGRTPLQIRQSGAVAIGDKLTVIGHPMTLPTKIAGGSSAVRNINNPAFFVASLDTYGGNSGSAVFNSQTYEVEGILVRGETDMRQTAQGCAVSNVCTQDGCRGEDVTRISEVLPHLVPEQPIDGETTQIVAEEASLSVAIPDNDATGVTQPLMVNGNGEIARVGVRVKLSHSYPGDLSVSLVHPDGTTVELLSEGNDVEAGEIDLAFGEGGQAVAGLRALQGKQANGNWKLVVKDNANADVGMLKAVKLTLDVLVPQGH